jgi:ribosomal protein L40E
VSHDVIISYSSKDKPTADAVCVALEANGIRCWVAPRDILAGMDWGESIIDAINECKLMVLVFSSNANESPQIKREVERAAHRGIPIIPFRIDGVNPSKSLEYFISTPHWLDALTPPMESHLQDLARSVKVLMKRASDSHDSDNGARPPPQLVAPPAPASEQYRTAVEIAWANGRIEGAEVESLDMLARKIGLAPAWAADIEREVMGDTKQNIALTAEARSHSDARAATTGQNAEAATKKRFNFCRKCGNRLVPGAHFCTKCGERLD